MDVHDAVTFTLLIVGWGYKQAIVEAEYQGDQKTDHEPGHQFTRYIVEIAWRAHLMEETYDHINSD
jgi:hypothetical protein